jgi:asparagine synthetase B (glutamine-hydrolysing)
VADNMFKGLTLGKFNTAHPAESKSLNRHTESVQHLRHHLCESLKLRILNIPLPPGSDTGHHVRLAILFSGGLDCTILARMAHDILPLSHQIDLINVAFENPRVVKAASNAAKSRNGGKKAAKNGNGYANYQALEVEDDCLSEYSPFECCPDRETGRKAFQELHNVCPGRCWRFVAVSVTFAVHFSS